MTLPSDLGRVRLDGELPARADLPLVFDALDLQLATQVYLWALPLVSYAQWQQQHRTVFMATDYDIVHYVTYADRLGLITANATTPYLVAFIDLGRTGPLVVEVPPGPVAGGRRVGGRRSPGPESDRLRRRRPRRGREDVRHEHADPPGGGSRLNP